MAGLDNDKGEEDCAHQNALRFSSQLSEAGGSQQGLSTKNAWFSPLNVIEMLWWAAAKAARPGGTRVSDAKAGEPYAQGRPIEGGPGASA